MAVRPIDANELLGIERLLDTDVVRQSKTASWLLDQVLHDIQAMPTLTPPNEWVSVYDRLPEPGERVLATDCGFVGEFYINKRGKWQRYNVNCSELLMALDILYWMPLPAPPGKDNNVPTKSQNEPLTLDELLTMDGEPVYVVFRPDGSGERSQSWALVNVDEKYGEVYLVDSIPGASCYYDEIWADLEGIYRRPPEGEENT